MSDKGLKDLRKQLRNICQDLAPELLSNELFLEVEKRINARIDARCDAIAKHIDTTLKAIDNRQKEVQSFLIRNTTHVPVASKEEATPNE